MLFGYNQELNKTELSLKDILRDFELLKEHSVDVNSSKVLDRVVQLKQTILLIKIQTIQAYESFENYDVLFFKRILVEKLILQCDGIDRTLNQIGFEILAERANLLQFRRTHYSAVLGQLLDKFEQQMEPIADRLSDVDVDVQNVLLHNTNRDDVKGKLQNLTTSCKKLKDQISTVYGVENSKSLLVEQELPLLHRYIYGLMINILVYLMQTLNNFVDIIDDLPV